MPDQTGGFIWYELMTTDPEGAKAFYEPVVGWSMTTGHGDTDDYGFLTAPDGAIVGGLLRLTGEMTAGGARPGWLGYIAVADVDATVREIEAKGGRCLMPARDVEMAGRIAMVADPGGAPFYVMKPRPPEGSEGGVSTAFQSEIDCGHCGWNELMAGDAGREIGFYTGLFGWSLPEAMDMGPMGKYQFVAHDGVTLGAIMGATPQAPEPHWNHYFWAKSIAAAKTAIEANGGTVTNGPMQVPGGGWIVQGLDPQGAAFSLVGGE
ncbi:MAG TPA: VOC family protein [Reyranella sp.]|nr:VOC family protein [Reyranella sp.]